LPSCDIDASIGEIRRVVSALAPYDKFLVVLGGDTR
jgi:hypothetical protein